MKPIMVRDSQLEDGELALLIAFEGGQAVVVYADGRLHFRPLNRLIVAEGSSDWPLGWTDQLREKVGA